jgi:hypothetical protein
MDQPKQTTSRNHYFPIFLINNWVIDAKSKEVLKTLIQPQYENHNKSASTRQVLYDTKIYNEATESQTSKDDSELSQLIQLMKSNLSEANPVFKNSRFLQLIFKLFCRQPSLNETIINSTYQSLLNEPYLTCGVRNISQVRNDRRFKQWVNAQCLQETPYDISQYYCKAKFTFYINQTNTPFILPDNTNTLLLPLSPRILVKLDFNDKNPLVHIEDITDPYTIEQINSLLIQNCTLYYISQKADK